MSGPVTSGDVACAGGLVSRRVAGLVLGCALTSCSTAPVVPVRPAASASPSPAVTPATAPPACTPDVAIARWPLARLAAQVVVAPALGGQLTALDAVVRQGVGGLLILGSAPATLHQQTAGAQSAATTPLLIMADQEGGGVQRLGSLVDSLPWPRTMAQTMSSAAVQAAAARVGAQMKALGVTMDLAPVLDLDDRPGPSDSNPDGLRSFSADSAVASSYGLAFAEGLAQAGVLAVAKHFPGLGGSTANTDVGPVTLAPLQSTGGAALAPFLAAAHAGIPALMMSNAIVPPGHVPASLDGSVVTAVVRGSMHFDGLVLTDSLSAGAVSAAGYTVPAAAVAGIEAGDDMVLFGSTLTPQETALLSPAHVAESVASIVTALTAAVQHGALPESRLDDAVLHVLAAKGVDPCAAP